MSEPTWSAGDLINSGKCGLIELLRVAYMKNKRRFPTAP